MTEAARPVVLFVDDEAHVLSALRRGLRREPITIETASSARAALTRLEEGPVALVVSDYKMQGMSGIELLKTIRAKWPETQRILLSGWSSEIPAAELDAAGLHSVVSKPWDDIEIRTMIRSAVRISLRKDDRVPKLHGCFRSAD